MLTPFFSAMADTYIPSPVRPRLRPCLSPSRYPATPSSTPLASQRPSFSSDSTFVIKAKSVRWEAGMQDCAVTCYFQTYSAQEYDRSPLEPPSEEERACTLPERGARRLDRTLEQGEIRTHSLPLPARPADEEDDWEETVDRRRMMFARSLAGNGSGPCAEFSGYRSLSASLATLLASIEDDGPSSSAASSTPSSPEYRPIPTLPHDVFNKLTSLCLPERICESPCELDEDDTPSLSSSATSSAPESALTSPTKAAYATPEHSEVADVPGLSLCFATGDGDRDRGRSRRLVDDF